jgi:epoxyqueuosine reductase QueG
MPYNGAKREGQNLAAYAVNTDYHLTIKNKLDNICKVLNKEFNESFLPYVDSSPVNEIKAALFSGIGFKGKNNLFILNHYDFIY